jgi:iron uptake system EfeUOB component EfeO/EfeM
MRVAKGPVFRVIWINHIQISASASHLEDENQNGQRKIETVMAKNRNGNGAESFDFLKEIVQFPVPLIINS